MALETSTYINGLVATNPTSTDNVGDGDNHIRLLKSTIKSSFPNITGAVTATHSAINSGVSLANTATNANTASSIVKRDGSGNFSAGTISANLSGDVTGNVTGNLTGNVTGNVTGNASTSSSTSGNAATATRLATTRTISLSGDVTGSASFNGTGNATISATVGNDSHQHSIAYVNGLQSALNAKLASSSYTASDVMSKVKSLDGSGSGLDADTLDGLQASAFVRDSDTTQSLSSNGWVKLPNGLIIQWGLATSVAEGTVKYVNYNTNFTTSVYAINATPRSISATNNYEADKYSVGVYSYSNSQFRMMSEGTSAGTLSIYWMAIGK